MVECVPCLLDARSDMMASKITCGFASTLKIVFGSAGCAFKVLAALLTALTGLLTTGAGAGAGAGFATGAGAGFATGAGFGFGSGLGGLITFSQLPLSTFFILENLPFSS